MNLPFLVDTPCHKKEAEIRSSSQQKIPQNERDKFGIKVAKTVEEALTLDKKNGNDLWWKAKQKEMSAVKVAFKVLDKDDKPPVGSEYMKCHMVFSIKMEDFSRKAHLVAGGHKVTRCKHIFFLKKKSDQTEMVSSWLKGIKDNYKIQIHFISYDNAGENKKLEEKYGAEGLGINFEYTATGTPQQNAFVERAFPTIMGRARPMMNFAGLTTEKRKQLWCEAANTATMLDIFLVHEQNSAPPYTMFYGQDAKCAKHLRTFGEIYVTTDTSNKTGKTKLDTRGRLTMFMGYSTQHAVDVYRFLHLKTNHIIYSRDVQWLGKM